MTMTMMMIVMLIIIECYFILFCPFLFLFCLDVLWSKKQIRLLLLLLFFCYYYYQDNFYSTSLGHFNKCHLCELLNKCIFNLCKWHLLLLSYLNFIRIYLWYLLMWRYGTMMVRYACSTSRLTFFNEYWSLYLFSYNA